MIRGSIAALLAGLALTLAACAGGAEGILYTCHVVDGTGSSWQAQSLDRLDALTAADEACAEASADPTRCAVINCKTGE